ncbi:hypothetical protein T440DRAFT_432484 [Plenodomus tracheiphilus IPT5]|uniref:Rhodopsin domain-containing protein n=1 Tax=Plenodomus tracheiphilus IPT5 TaxID=1408161 RepID=A0A6A7AWE0_9PLEO|nr:hypothetical protein T440DRAFT_432484 [Plenodomus tracheiphilus IPT5]
MTYIRPGFMVVIVGATLTSISTVIVGLRYYCRYFLMGTITASDHLMMTALVLTWGNFVINYYQDETSSKFRPSQFRIPEKRPQIEQTVRAQLITWWLYRITYIAALCFVKLSILYFYRAIAAQRTFRRVVHATIAFVSLYTIAAVIAGIFQCQNVSDSWSTADFFANFDRNSDIKRKKLACFDPTKLWIFCGAANLLTDVVILLMPIPALLSLRVPVSKRLALIGIFSIGIMAIIASSVRMWVMMLWAESPSNSARFGVDLLLWGQVETNAGIISASVPFLRLLFTGKERQERAATPARVVDIGPPKPMGGDQLSQNRAPHLETWAFGFDDDKVAEKSPRWGPFITVPESLSSRSRSSAKLEATRPHSAV